MFPRYYNFAICLIAVGLSLRVSTVAALDDDQLWVRLEKYLPDIFTGKHIGVGPIVPFVPDMKPLLKHWIDNVIVQENCFFVPCGTAWKHDSG